MRIAFLGLGAMGARMAARLIGAGHELTVWNRNPERTPSLVALGAAAAASPAAAAASADFVVGMVRDDEAARSVWLAPDVGALAAMRADALAIECSTVTPAWARTLHAEAAAHGLGALDAPVLGSRPQAEAGALIVLAGGAAEDVRRAEPALAAFSAAVHHAGGPGAGAALKLVANGLYAIQVAALAELMGLARSAGLDPARVVDILAATPTLSLAAKAAATGMLAGAFAPNFPVELVEKDLGYAVALAGPQSSFAPSSAPLTNAARATFAAAAAYGWGGDNLTRVAELYRSGETAPAYS